TFGTISYPGGRLPAPIRRPFRLLGLLALTRSWRLLPAALGMPGPERIGLSLGGSRYSLRTRPLRELWIDLGILWELAVAGVYPLPDTDEQISIVDVGAHRGHFVVWATARLPGAEIHAYEPDDANAAELERAVVLNRCSERVTLHREAVAAREGTRRFMSDPRSDAGHLATEGRAVPAVGLGTVISRCRTPRVYLKVDAEGAEHEAFAALGADAPEAARRIVAVALEWHPPVSGETDVRRSLEALGFEVRSRMLGIGNGIVHAWPRGRA
ncbi:MAG TPA: FkbM family methyltransferase, partial [Candidatus Limnocylindrales bacterium]|nr:FkbM family methyltransferase [Candidatus Limnocylindrales bacterium]